MGTRAALICLGILCQLQSLLPFCSGGVSPRLISGIWSEEGCIVPPEKEDKGRKLWGIATIWLMDDPVDPCRSPCGCIPEGMSPPLVQITNGTDDEKPLFPQVNIPTEFEGHIKLVPPSGEGGDSTSAPCALPAAPFPFPCYAPPPPCSMPCGPPCAMPCAPPPPCYDYPPPPPPFEPEYISHEGPVTGEPLVPKYSDVEIHLGERDNDFVDLVVSGEVIEPVLDDVKVHTGGDDEDVEEPIEEDPETVVVDPESQDPEHGTGHSTVDAGHTGGVIGVVSSNVTITDTEIDKTKLNATYEKDSGANKTTSHTKGQTVPGEAMCPCADMTPAPPITTWETTNSSESVWNNEQFDLNYEHEKRRNQTIQYENMAAWAAAGGAVGGGPCEYPVPIPYYVPVYDPPPPPYFEDFGPPPPYYEDYGPPPPPYYEEPYGPPPPFVDVVPFERPPPSFVDVIPFEPPLEPPPPSGGLVPYEPPFVWHEPTPSHFEYPSPPPNYVVPEPVRAPWFEPVAIDFGHDDHYPPQRYDEYPPGPDPYDTFGPPPPIDLGPPPPPVYPTFDPPPHIIDGPLLPPIVDHVPIDFGYGSSPTPSMNDEYIQPPHIQDQYVPPPSYVVDPEPIFPPPHIHDHQYFPHPYMHDEYLPPPQFDPPPPPYFGPPPVIHPHVEEVPIDFGHDQSHNPEQPLYMHDEYVPPPHFDPPPYYGPPPIIHPYIEEVPIDFGHGFYPEPPPHFDPPPYINDGHLPPPHFDPPPIFHPHIEEVPIDFGGGPYLPHPVEAFPPPHPVEAFPPPPPLPEPEPPIGGPLLPPFVEHVSIDFGTPPLVFEPPPPPPPIEPPPYVPLVDSHLSGCRRNPNVLCNTWGGGVPTRTLDGGMWRTLAARNLKPKPCDVADKRSDEVIEKPTLLEQARIISEDVNKETFGAAPEHDDEEEEVAGSESASGISYAPLETVETHDFAPVDKITPLQQVNGVASHGMFIMDGGTFSELDNPPNAGLTNGNEVAHVPVQTDTVHLTSDNLVTDASLSNPADLLSFPIESTGNIPHHVENGGNGDSGTETEYPPDAPASLEEVGSSQMGDSQGAPDNDPFVGTDVVLTNGHFISADFASDEHITGIDSTVVLNEQPADATADNTDIVHEETENADSDITHAQPADLGSDVIHDEIAGVDEVHEKPADDDFGVVQGQLAEAGSDIGHEKLEDVNEVHDEQITDVDLGIVHEQTADTVSHTHISHDDSDNPEFFVIDQPEYVASDEVHEQLADADFDEGQEQSAENSVPLDNGNDALIEPEPVPPHEIEIDQELEPIKHEHLEDETVELAPAVDELEQNDNGVVEEDEESVKNQNVDTTDEGVDTSYETVYPDESPDSDEINDSDLLSTNDKTDSSSELISNIVETISNESEQEPQNAIETNNDNLLQANGDTPVDANDPVVDTPLETDINPSETVSESNLDIPSVDISTDDPEISGEQAQVTLENDPVPDIEPVAAIDPTPEQLEPAEPSPSKPTPIIIPFKGIILPYGQWGRLPCKNCFVPKLTQISQGRPF